MTKITGLKHDTIYYDEVLNMVGIDPIADQKKKIPEEELNKVRGLPLKELNEGAKYHVYIYYPNGHMREYDKNYVTIYSINERYVSFAQELPLFPGQIVNTTVQTNQVVEEFYYVDKKPDDFKVTDQQYKFRPIA